MQTPLIPQLTVSKFSQPFSFYRPAIQPGHSSVSSVTHDIVMRTISGCKNSFNRYMGGSQEVRRTSGTFGPIF